eukprot:GILI01017250.1.p1 GENE.GILI01017250.1~~GILI01017250.1.p1  ORF type:complete len:148 (-),score=31.80 GILI01017250.1:95-511(-)
MSKSRKDEDLKNAAFLPVPQAVEEEDPFTQTLLYRILVNGIWYATAIVTFLLFVFLSYQLYALYIPYTLAWMNGSLKSHRFPDYFYTVWGEDATSLDREHWTLLGVGVFMLFLSFYFVLLDDPLPSRRSKVDQSKKSQ